MSSSLNEPTQLIELIFLRPRMFYGEVQSLHELVAFVRGVCTGYAPPHGSCVRDIAEFVHNRFQRPVNQHWTTTLLKQFEHLELFEACAAIGEVFTEWKRSCSAQVLTLRLSSDEVLRIARLDAERVYRDLSRFVIRIAREPDGWHVDFDLQDTTARGGGPHYVIDPDSGAIVMKRYEQ